MKILFIGTVESSYRALLKLIEIKADVVGVVTKERSPYNADFVELAPVCLKYSIPYYYSKNINCPEEINWVRALSPDILCCFGFSSLFKSEILSVAPMGVIGFHPAKLPMNRGRHPLIWALALGLKETASSFFFMDEGADSGDLLSQVAIPINEEDDARTLYDKVMDTALQQIEDFVPKLADGSYRRTPQDHNLANYWRKRKHRDGKIDFRMNSRSINNLVRALTKPYVGAHVEINGHEFKVWKVVELDNEQHNYEHGKILRASNDGIDVKCANGAIRLLDHEFIELPDKGEYFSE